MNSFDVYRSVGYRLVGGWLSREVLEILAVLDAEQHSRNISGPVAEIGVHHGRLFIGLNLLRRDDEYSIAIDVFGDQTLNIDKSGKGSLRIFRRNVERWSSLDRVVVHQGDSTKLQPETLRGLGHGDIRIISVDGGHTDSTVFSDMNLAEVTLAPGGILIADDVFNQVWPGVSTGTLRYMADGGKLAPFLIGFNKVFFTFPEYADTYRAAVREHFRRRLSIEMKMSDFASHEVLIMTRVPRWPWRLVKRSDTARQAYQWLQEWRF